ncbi:MAG: hypothetical protein WBQ18_10750 [Solirubrobacteraceae bacterium]
MTDPEVATVLDWWDRHAREVPWRATRDVYGVWVAEVMSAQTTLARAADAWVGWIARWPTVDALAAASLTEVLVQWQGLGYPRRARDLHRSARIVSDAGWPDELTELPGIGPYVAAAIRCFALEQPVLPRDVNVTRVLARRFPGGIDISGDPWRAGQALMEFGQQVCTALPRCGQCPVRAGCAGPNEARLPGRPPQKRFAGSVRQHRGRLLARVLAEGGVAVGDAHPDAAAGLLQDGLLVLDGERLRPPA